MTLRDVKGFIGATVDVTFKDRFGNLSRSSGRLLEVEYVAMYGNNLVFDFGEISIDRLVSLSENAGKRAA